MPPVERDFEPINRHAHRQAERNVQIILDTRVNRERRIASDNVHTNAQGKKHCNP